MLNLHVLRSPAFSAASISVGLAFLGIGGALFILTQYLQDVQGHSPLGAGVRLLPVAIALVVFSPLSIVLEERIGTKLTVVLGLSLITTGLAITTTLAHHPGYTLVFAGLLLAGAGAGLAITPAVNAMLGAASQAKLGASAALYNTAMVGGTALGVAIIGSLLATGYADHLARSLHGVPTAAGSSARTSVGVAVATGRHMGGSQGESLITAARSAFILSAAHAFLFASLIAASGAAVAARFLPHRPNAESHGPSGVQGPRGR